MPSQTPNQTPNLPRASRIKHVAPLLLLCPLLAVSDSVINAVGLSVVAILVTTTAGFPLTFALRRLPEYGRIAVVVIVTSGVVTSATLLAHAWFYDLYRAIGVYLPLLVAGGLLLARNDVAAPMEQRRLFLLAGLKTGLMFSALLVTLGAIREFVGHGSLFFGAEALPGEFADGLITRFFPPDYGFVLAVLPPGAFIASGIVLAIRNFFRNKQT
jgi:Na+-translocating ferredoxin:NAD+ oxidoreductase subunit E